MSEYRRIHLILSEEGERIFQEAFEKMWMESLKEQPRSKRIKTNDIGKAVNRLNKKNNGKGKKSR